MALKIAAVADKTAIHTLQLLQQMFPAGRDYANDRRPDLLRDLGSLLLTAGARSAAIQALSAAHKERPGGLLIKRILDQAQAEETGRVPQQDT